MLFFNYLISAFIFLPCIQCIIENVLRIKNVKKKEKKSRQSLKVMNAPAICNCDLDLGNTKLKCKLVRVIVIINVCVKS